MTVIQFYATGGKKQVQNLLRRRDEESEGLVVVDQDVPAFEQYARLGDPVTARKNHLAIGSAPLRQNLIRRREDFADPGLAHEQLVPAFDQVATIETRIYVAGFDPDVCGYPATQFLLRRRAEFDFLLAHDSLIPPFETLATLTQTVGFAASQLIPRFPQVADVRHITLAEADQLVPDFDQAVVVAHLGFLNAQHEYTIEDFTNEATIGTVPRLTLAHTFPMFGTFAHATNYDFTDPNPNRTLTVKAEDRVLVIKAP
jgi:hypothetical protein